jgi:hypothetical protein
VAFPFEFPNKNYVPHTLLKNYNCLIKMSSLMYVQNHVTIYDTACQTCCVSHAQVAMVITFVVFSVNL